MLLRGQVSPTSLSSKYKEVIFPGNGSVGKGLATKHLAFRFLVPRDAGIYSHRSERVVETGGCPGFPGWSAQGEVGV